MNATVPLAEAIPWSPKIPRKILVCDSIETDGAFFLHTFASQVLKEAAGGHNLLWLTGRAVTNIQIATALKRIGCDVAATYLRNTAAGAAASHTGPLQITSLTTEIMSKVLEADDPSFDGEVFLKDVYRQVKTWAASRVAEDAPCCWLVLDDMSSLASVLGDESLVFQFVDSIIALTMRVKNLGLMIRCSAELDQTITRQSHMDSMAQDKTGWLGSGGSAQKEEARQIHKTWIPWERTIVDSMDIVVDVIPLSSGYSREAHGRLVFTEYPGGRGWSQAAAVKPQNAGTTPAATSSSSAWNKLVINYCLQDGGVRAIRLREGTSKA